MRYNFDEIVDRKGTACYKYDLAGKYFNNHDVLPMWVADMDFKTPDFIIDAIQTRLKHPVLGYSYHPVSQYKSILNWLQTRHNWTVQQEWIGFTPGVVPALNFTVLEFTDPGDKIIIQSPVYFPFYSAVKDHGRKMLINPLKLKDGRYTMDLEHLKQNIDSGTRMLILCSPHNPTGNVWRKEELEALAAICLENDILIISDEIHADIVYPDNRHMPSASISKEIADHTITLMAPSKTFNIAGLSTSYYIASKEELFSRLEKAIGKLHLGMGNILGNVALEAAYNFGEEWLDQLIEYLLGNIAFAKEFINSRIPGLQLIEPEATFLLWIDCRSAGMSDKEFRSQLLKKARVGLSNGILFGTDGEGFQRINMGCPRKILEQGLNQIAGIFR